MDTFLARGRVHGFLNAVRRTVGRKSSLVAVGSVRSLFLQRNAPLILFSPYVLIESSTIENGLKLENVLLLRLHQRHVIHAVEMLIAIIIANEAAITS